MEHEPRAIAALERILLAVEAELISLHTGDDLDPGALDERLSAELTGVAVGEPRMTVPAAPNGQMSAPRPAGPPPPRPPVLPPPPPSPPSPSSIPPPPPAVGRTPVPPPSSRLTLEWLFRVGGISLVVLGAVFFVSTAISRGWIGPTAQLALATATSLGIVAQSFRFNAQQRPWRITMAAGGAAAFFATGVVGHLGLDLLNTPAAIGWLSLAVLGFLALARAHGSQSLAVLGAPATALGAVLVSASVDATAAVLLLVGIGWTVALAGMTAGQRWFVARAAGGVVGAGVILLGAAASVDAGISAVTLGGAIAGVIAVWALGAQQLREFDLDDLTSLVEARVAAGILPWTALVAALVVGTEASGTIAGWTTVAIGLGGVAVANLASGRVHPTMIMLHQVAGMGTATVGLVSVLDGPVLLGALLVQATVTGVLALQTRSPEMFTAATLLAGVVLAWTTVLTAAAFIGSGFALGDLVVTAMVLLVSFVVAWSLRNTTTMGVTWVVVWIAALGWVATAWQAVPQTQMWVSLSWVLMGIGLLVSRSVWTGSAQREQFRTAVHAGLATLALTGGKLIFVDLVAVDVLWRAGLFFVIGAVFLRLAFVLPNLLEQADDGIST